MHRLYGLVRDGVVEAVYPRTCAGCGKRGTWLCESCAEETLMTHTPVSCIRCGIPVINGMCDCSGLPSSITSAMACAAYDGWVAQSVKGLKYHHERERGSYMGALMAPFLPSFGRVDALVPVPVDPRRLIRRGYNQAEVLARAISAETGVPVALLLEKTHSTVSQTTLSAAQRRANVRGAFALRKDIVVPQGGHIVLVDDVRTTGSTLGACADALVGIQPAAVHALTFSADFTPDEVRRLRQMKAVGFRQATGVP